MPPREPAPPRPIPATPQMHLRVFHVVVAPSIPSTHKAKPIQKVVIANSEQEALQVANDYQRVIMREMVRRWPETRTMGRVPLMLTAIPCQDPYGCPAIAVAVHGVRAALVEAARRPK